ncbi:unnamed protein product [Thelazia callipaeda]|uniref:t-SNARE coiled-coil homology domain-containing protein n=1 Tax=Thelazia callipaeda TaxID=103827 RepID=A0A0N5D3P0_THECL|nr:unnamed protein product [Thelazia callipaeda]
MDENMKATLSEGKFFHAKSIPAASKGNPVFTNISTANTSVDGMYVVENLQEADILNNDILDLKDKGQQMKQIFGNFLILCMEVIFKNYTAINQQLYVAFNLSMNIYYTCCWLTRSQICYDIIS